MILTSLLYTLLSRSLKPLEFDNSYSNSLNFEHEKDLGLYVHIPFCKSLCSFCPYAKVLYDKELASRYKEALIKEIALVGSQLKVPKKVTSLYFGGGTPALMADDLKDIIHCLREYFIIEGGIGIELHPDNVTDELLFKLKEAGFTMISLGIQSFHPQSLAALGRKVPDFTCIFEAVRAADFSVVDVDLIFAIPGQSPELLIEDINTAFESGATQISTYPFIDFTFAKNKYKPLPERYKRRLLDAITDYCRRSDYQRTSVWTFARKNTEKYSSITRNSFLGFGASATTLLKEQFKINTFTPEAYIERINSGSLPTSLTLNFTLRQRVLYYLFWNAYTMTIDEDKFEDFFQIPLSRLYGFEFNLCQRLGLIKKDGGCLRLTDRGAYFYHFIEQAYTRAYIDRMWNISRKISFPEKIILH